MKKVMVLEISGVTEEEIQEGFGKAFHDFCKEYKGSGIAASVLEESTGNEVINLINQEDNK